jgi:hypothetical protein
MNGAQIREDRTLVTFVELLQPIVVRIGMRRGDKRDQHEHRRENVLQHTAMLHHLQRRDNRRDDLETPPQLR